MKFYQANDLFLIHYCAYCGEHVAFFDSMDFLRKERERLKFKKVIGSGRLKGRTDRYYVNNYWREWIVNES